METKARDFLEELLEIEEGNTSSLEITIPVVELVDDELLQLMPSLATFTVIERRVIELSTQGNRPKDVAMKLALPISAVEALLCRKEVQDHLRLLSEAMNQLELMRLKSLYAQAIEDRVDKALESGDHGDISRKDTLDIIKSYQDLLLAERKGKGPEKEQDIYVSILQQVMA